MNHKSLVLLIVLFTLFTLKPVLAATIQLQSGWNMFSIPVSATVDAETIRSKCGTAARIWNYNASSRTYVDTTQLVPGLGYWIKLNSTCTLSVGDSAVSVGDFPSLKSGWNQIGTASQSIDFSTIRSSTSCNILSGPWLYNSSTNNYNSSNTLNPGIGYWLRVGSSCSLTSAVSICSDETAYGQCSSVEADKPDWCDPSTGKLVLNQCNSPHNCPCPSDQSCNSTTGSCYTPTSCDSACKLKGYDSGSCESGSTGFFNSFHTGCRVEELYTSNWSPAFPYVKYSYSEHVLIINNDGSVSPPASDYPHQWFPQGDYTQDDINKAYGNGKVLIMESYLHGFSGLTENGLKAYFLALSHRLGTNTAIYCIFGEFNYPTGDTDIWGGDVDQMPTPAQYNNIMTMARDALDSQGIKNILLGVHLNMGEPAGSSAYTNYMTGLRKADIVGASQYNKPWQKETQAQSWAHAKAIWDEIGTGKPWIFEEYGVMHPGESLIGDAGGWGTPIPPSFINDAYSLLKTYPFVKGFDWYFPPESLETGTMDAIVSNAKNYEGGGATSADTCQSGESPIGQDGCSGVCCCSGNVQSCSSLTYPADRWQRVWYTHSTGACLGDGPGEYSATFDNNWALGVVAYNQADDIQFSSSRNINFATAGTYTFTLGSDDGARLWVDDALQIDKWIDRGYTTDSVTLQLKAGNHRFRIDYYENGGNAEVSFSYSQTVTPSGWKVFQNSTGNYLQNKAGQVIKSSSDATAVINAAIANAVSGDTIYIDAGTYTMTSSITGSVNGITLTLASGAIIKAPANFQVSLLSLYNVRNWIIQGGEWDGNAAHQPFYTSGSAGTGIWLQTCTNCTVQNIYMHDVRMNGIYLTYGCSDCKILNSHVDNVGANGINLGEDWSGQTSTNCIAQGNLVERCGDVFIHSSGINCQIINNTIQNMDNSYSGYVNTHWGIGLEETHVSGNLVQGNTITGVWGIVQGQDQIRTTNHQILNNKVQCSQYCIAFISGNGNTISNNALSGTGTGIAMWPNAAGPPATGSNYNTGTGNSYDGLPTHVSNQGTGNSVS